MECPKEMPLTLVVIKNCDIFYSGRRMECCWASDWNGHFVIYFMSIFNDFQEFADLLSAPDKNLFDKELREDKVLCHTGCFKKPRRLRSFKKVNYSSAQLLIDILPSHAAAEQTHTPQASKRRKQMIILKCFENKTATHFSITINRMKRICNVMYDDK